MTENFRVREVLGRAIVVRGDDIDTDRIIPARFLRSVTFEGLGEHAFEDDRRSHSGGQHPFDRPEFQGASILIVGGNFGCGSSREHAAWALHDLGLRAVLSTSLADIFRANALKNGLLALEIGAEPHAWLREHPFAPVVVDLEAQRVAAGDWVAAFDVDCFARHCLRRGVDELGHLLGQLPAITAYEEQR